jgi:hypothetical protein
MKPITLALLAAVALPSLAVAQIYREPPMDRGTLRTCMERDASLRHRLETLERERMDNDREGARLADELRGLDSTNASAVAAYNERSAAHNRRVADMNGRVAEHNADASFHSGQCAGRSYLMRDADAVVRNRR